MVYMAFVPANLNLSKSYISESWGGWSLIQNLNNLKDLDLSYCRNLTRTPDFSETNSLERLEFRCCSKLREIHGSIACSRSELDCTSLRKLTLSGSSMFKLPSTIGQLPLLEKLILRRNNQLQELSDLPLSLRILTLTDSSISTLASNISQLLFLEELHLERNHQLRELPDLPLSLRELSVSSMSLQNTPDLSRLTNLTYLKLLKSDDYRWRQQQLPKSKFEGINKLTELQRLKLGLASATALLQFDLGSLTRLQLDFHPDLDCIPLLPSGSLDVDISQGSLELNLPDLSSLKNLFDLSLKNCLIEDGELLESLEIQHLGNLTDVDISNCGVELIGLICPLKNLTSLDISDCGSLKALPDLSELKALHSLYISDCKELVEIPGLEKLESLHDLFITRCDSLERLENLSKLEKLSDISLRNCLKLRIIVGTERMVFSTLRISNCRSLQNMDELRKRSKSGWINGIRFRDYI